MRKNTVTLVDIGSNTIRTSVYRIGNRGSNFRKIVDMSKSIGLSGYVDESGVMSAEGIEAGCHALSKMVRVSELTENDAIHIFATGAVRNCVNTAEVVHALCKETGHPIRILTGREEAVLSASGSSRATGVKTGLFFDLGGGSTELIDVSKKTVIGADSIPIGSLSSWRSTSSAILLEPEDVKSIEDEFASRIEASPVRVEGQSVVVGAGGSMRFALKVAKHLRGEGAEGSLLLSDLDMIISTGINSPETLSRIVLGLKPERIHTLMPACAIARTILRCAGSDGMVVSKAGLREGYLMSQFCMSVLSDPKPKRAISA